MLALGVRASKQAVAWERKVARYHAKVKKRAAAERKRAQAEQAERARLRAQELAEARKVADEQLKTDVVPEGEIRQAIARGKADRDAAVKRRKEEMSSKEETQTARRPSTRQPNVRMPRPLTSRKWDCPSTMSEAIWPKKPKPLPSSPRRT